ncbi:hypothetical protein JXM83_06000 [Candidatus Woesearchaeota archaeon]|nr:hypothetical protein [Candidatus Woesearchaeota archaeon]
MQLTYDAVVGLIVEKTGIKKEDVEKKIKLKIDSLSGLISKDGASHIVAHELGVEVESDSPGKLSVKNLVSGMRNVTVEVKITRLFDKREFKRSDGSQGKVLSGYISDDTGSIRIVLWNDAADLSISESDVLRISNAYIKENRGNNELNVNDPSLVEINPEGVEIKEVFQPTFSSEVTRKEISGLSAGDNNIEVLGTIVQVFDLRFYEVCPECNKRIKPETGCPEHGNVDTKWNYVLNVVLDDNSGNIRLVLFNDLVDALFSVNRDKILEYRTTSDFNSFKDSVLGNMVKVSGRVNNNSMFDRLEFVVRTLTSEVDFKSEIDSLKSMLKVQKEELEDLDDEVSEETVDEEE